MSALRPYLAVLGARFRMLLQYRAAALAGFGTQLFWGLIRVMTFDAFYASSAAPQPMSHDEVVSYVWLGQAFFALLPWQVDPDVRDVVRSGTVAYELLRPLDLYALWFSRSVASRTAPTALRAIPVLVLASLFFGLRAPPTLAALALWLVAGVAAVLLSSAIATLITVSLLWTISGEGIARTAPTVVFLLSGMLVPVPLLPPAARLVLDALPFRGLVDGPFRIYLGHAAPGEALLVVGHQLAWTAALVLLGRWALRRSMRRLVIQGG